MIPFILKILIIHFFLQIFYISQSVLRRLFNVLFNNPLFCLYLLLMHSLKSALGKDTQANEQSVSVGNPSKTFSKAKNGSMWALDPEEDEDEQKIKDSNQKTIKEFQLKIINVFEKDSTFSEIIFFEIIQQIQAISEGMDELTRLHQAEKAAIKVSQTHQQSLKQFANSFLECLIRRIKKLRKKQKKAQLQEYDKIIKTNFKKKNAVYIDQGDLDTKETASKPIRNISNYKRLNHSKSIGQGSSSKRNGSSSSNEGKLRKLISNTGLKDEIGKQTKDEMQNQEESVSFSAVVSQSMVVRQRKPKEPKNKKKQQEVAQKLEQKQSDGNDAAFIFYRPKAGRKK